MMTQMNMLERQTVIAAWEKKCSKEDKTEISPAWNQRVHLSLEAGQVWNFHLPYLVGAYCTVELYHTTCIPTERGL